MHMYVFVYMRICSRGDLMTKRMTVVFHDEELYTTLKVEAARRHQPASDIVAEAVNEWLERRENALLLPIIREAQEEYRRKGGRSWDETRKDLEKPTVKSKKPEQKRVRY